MGVLGVSADYMMLTHWCRLVAVAATHEHVVPVPLMGTATCPIDHYVVVLDRQEPLTYLFWLRTLGAPITLIASSVNAAQPLLDRVPLIRLLCHTSHAVTALADMLTLTGSLTAGSLVFAAVPQRVIRAAPLEHRYAK